MNWHPHDKDRLIRFKLKYRFWGCLSLETRALTRRGWRYHYEIGPEDEILCLDPRTDEITWQKHGGVSVYDYDGDMVRWSGGSRGGHYSPLDVVATPNHRWIGECSAGRATVRGEFAPEFPGVLVTGGGTPLAFRSEPKWSDEMVETVAWYVCDGSDHTNRQGYFSIHLAAKKPHKVAAWRRLATWWTAEGATFREGKTRDNGQATFYLGKGVASTLAEVAPDKTITPEFLCSLTYAQARLFRDTLLAGDGYVRKGSSRWTQVDGKRRSGYQMLCAMLGIRTAQTSCGQKVQEYTSRYTDLRFVEEKREHYQGQVWCPTVPTGYFMAEHNGQTFWTGNTTLDGTRSVFTYCVDDKTEALTKRGWLTHDQMTTDDEVLAIDPVTDAITWQPVLAVNRFDWDGPLTRWANSRVDALTTPNHRWLVQDWRARDPRYAHRAQNTFKITEQLSGGKGSDQIVLGGGTPLAFAEQPKWADELVETIGWVVTEGYYAPKTGVIVTQSPTVNPEYCSRIRRLATWWKDEGAFVSEKQYSYDNCIHWYFGKNANGVIREVAPDKQLTPEFLCSLTYAQAKLLYDTLIDGDGHRRTDTGLETWAQKDGRRLDGFQMLCAMLGRRSNCRKSKHHSGSDVSVYTNRNMTAREVNARDEHYTGIVWCPSVPTKTWLARRNGTTYWTGNTEILTDSEVSEYINDELIDSHPNPLGEIPIVHAPNVMISSSPWGMPDIPGDFLTLNRQYNETATTLADIINYHSSPVTVIMGAKQGELQKGAAKVWSGLPKDASVFNLEMQSDAALAQSFMAMLKQAMHEMTGVPETALGQEQSVSNTSGVALQIQFQPLMMSFQQKSISYGKLYEKVNYFALRTLALKEPEAFVYDPTSMPPLKEGQLPILDTRDPLTFYTKSNFTSSLPIDKLIKLNEIITEIQLGLQSKRGALKELGIENPDERLEELFNEQVQDAKESGALELLKAQIQDVIMMATFSGGGVETGEGAPPGGGDNQDPNAAGTVGSGGDATPSDTQTNALSAPLPGTQVDRASEEDLLQQLSTKAMGTKLPQRRTPNDND